MLVRWTEPAVNDLTHICDYAKQRFDAAQARRTALAIFESIESLRSFPHKGRLGRRPNTRELSIPKLPFLAIYRIRNSTIEVNRILHGAQKWP